MKVKCEICHTRGMILGRALKTFPAFYEEFYYVCANEPLLTESQQGKLAHAEFHAAMARQLT